MDHIQKNNIEKFHQGTGIDTGDMIRFLEHLDHCDYCLEQMILEESAGSETRAPSWLSDEVLGRAASPEVQAAKMLSVASRRSRLFYYRLQTAAGVVIALMLLFCVYRADFSSIHSAPPRQAAESAVEQYTPDRPSGLEKFSRALGNGISQGSDKIADYLGDFPNNILRGGESK